MCTLALSTVTAKGDPPSAHMHGEDLGAFTHGTVEILNLEDEADMSEPLVFCPGAQRHTARIVPDRSEAGAVTEKVTFRGCYQSIVLSPAGLVVVRFGREYDKDGQLIRRPHLGTDEWSWDEIERLFWHSEFFGKELWIVPFPELRDDSPTQSRGRFVRVCSAGNLSRRQWRKFARTVPAFTAGRLTFSPSVPAGHRPFWKLRT
ncbi:hypothetical protein STBA_69300 [Streptomyces sp. MP131-18]|nr:hypothetical protein STBA_69300 [Streptomyces sp. MP131-18]